MLLKYRHLIIIIFLLLPVCKTWPFAWCPRRRYKEEISSYSTKWTSYIRFSWKWGRWWICRWTVLILTLFSNTMLAVCPMNKFQGQLKWHHCNHEIGKKVILALGYLYTKHDYAPWSISGLQLTIILYNVLVLMQYLSTVSPSKRERDWKEIFILDFSL